MIYTCIDYSNSISDEVINNAIKDIEHELEINLCTEVPLFQTYPVLFNKQETHWQILKETFINSLLNVYNVNKFNTIEAWGYVNKVGHKQPDNRWHTHNSTLYSGVMYLQIPKNSQGTLFVDDNQKIIEAPVKEKQWVIFNSNVQHAPPVWDYNKSDKDRLCLAAIAK